jgi:hypothetical protein
MDGGIGGERAREPSAGEDAPIFAEGQPSTTSDEGEQHWPEQRPMTPADFDRPFVEESAGQLVEQNRAEPEAARETRAQSQPAPEATAEPASRPSTQNEDKSSGERKKGWWKRVLS